MGSPQTDQGHWASDAIAKGPVGSGWGSPLEGSCLEWLLMTNSGREQSWGRVGGKRAVIWYLRTGSGLCYEMEAM